MANKQEKIGLVFQTGRNLQSVRDPQSSVAMLYNCCGVWKCPWCLQTGQCQILNQAQAYISEKLGDLAPANKKPVMFVFHGGSGSDIKYIQEAIEYGVIKMNIDTNTQLRSVA
jgi:fructose-bisphosphate aldolase, class II